MVKQTPFPTIAPVIVIIDDDFFRIAMDAVLQEWFGTGTVVTCATAKEAGEQLSNGTDFGLGIVDLNMPGIDIHDLLSPLIAAQPAMRIAVFSASRSSDDILTALSAGAHGFIDKGLGISEAEVAVRQIANGSVYVPPFLPQSARMAQKGDSGGKRTAVALTTRQRDVLRLLVEGRSNKGIARVLNITPSTVKFHISFIFQAFGVSNRVEAATRGARLLQEGGMRPAVDGPVLPMEE